MRSSSRVFSLGCSQRPQQAPFRPLLRVPKDRNCRFSDRYLRHFSLPCLRRCRNLLRWAARHHNADRLLQQLDGQSDRSMPSASSQPGICKIPRPSEKEVPRELEVRLIMNNYSTHKSPWCSAGFSHKSLPFPNKNEITSNCRKRSS